MAERGFVAWWPHDKLSVRGYFEVLGHFREILAIRNRLVERLLADKPDAFIYDPMNPVLSYGGNVCCTGTAVAAGALPAVYIVGFAVLALVPTLTVVLVFQVVQRWANFAVANPARQIFFTVAAREEKYKAKNFNDTVVYRGADAVSGWVKTAVDLLARQPGVAMVLGAIVALGWALTGSALARRQRALEASGGAPIPGEHVLGKATRVE